MNKFNKKTIISSFLIGLVLLVLPLQSEAIEYSGGFRSGILTYGVGTGSASLASSAASQWKV